MSEVETVSRTVKSHGVSLKKWLKVAVLSALAFVFMLFFRLPLLPTAPYLTYDFSDVPALLAAFAMGPMSGVAVELLKNALFLLFNPNVVEFVGVPMNALAGSALVWTAGQIYWRNKSSFSAVKAMASGTVVMIAVMVPCNVGSYYLLRWLTGMTGEIPLSVYLFYITLPFNCLKCLLTCSLTYLVYKRLSPLLKGSRDR